MSNENNGKRVRLSRPKSVPSRKKIPRQIGEDDSGFRTVTRGYTYDHDTSAIRLATTLLKKYAKNLEKLQKDIERKEQKAPSKQLTAKKKDYEGCLSDIQHELRELNRIFPKEEPNTFPEEKTDILTETKTEISRCDNCFTNEKEKMHLYAEIDRLKETLHAERASKEAALGRLKETVKAERAAKEEALIRLKETVQAERAAKEEALIRLRSYTASKLRDNNSNLTDLRDPCRPSKIAEMFAELYDDEWTDAFHELRKKNTEDEAIKKLNDLVMEAFNICGKLTEPLRLYLDTTSTKIDSKLRQKMVDHIKQKADIIIPKLKQNIVEENSKFHCFTRESNNTYICRYIDKTIEICWLMMIQDPPMHLYNTKTDKFDSKKYREYQNKGPCTAYIVWPAITLHKDGAMLSKGVAEGMKEMAYDGDVVNNVKVQTGSDDQENVNDRAKQIFPKEEPKPFPEEKTDVLTEMKTEISRCDNCFTNEKEKMHLYAEIDRLTHEFCKLKETLHAERASKEAALVRLKETVQAERAAKEEALIRLKETVQAERAAKEEALIRLKETVQAERAAKEEALIRLKETVQAERAAKEEALIRLRSYTASKLRDNNSNLTDLRDPCRPSKIAEMFAELYDDEWTDAFHELRKKNTEDEAIKKLNDLVMVIHST